MLRKTLFFVGAVVFYPLVILGNLLEAVGHGVWTVGATLHDELLAWSHDRNKPAEPSNPERPFETGRTSKKEV